MTDNNAGRGAFLYLAVITALSVALIALNPLLGMRIPFTVHFLVGYIGALLVFVIWHAQVTKGWRRALVMFALSFVIAFTAEALGVNYGLVFGRYFYTERLGLRLFGVPFLAALAWEPILYAAYSITDILVPARASRIGSFRHRLPSYLWLSLVGALATTAWDMMIDPIAVNGGWWVWQDGGPYVPYVEHGVPINNFTGWLGVAFVINLAYRLVADGAPQPPRSAYLTVHGPLTLYASLFLTAFGVTLTILQRPEVALVGLLAMGPFIAIAWSNVHVAGTERVMPVGAT